jgi:hypothetical protein
VDILLGSEVDIGAVFLIVRQLYLGHLTAFGTKKINTGIKVWEAGRRQVLFLRAVTDENHDFESFDGTVHQN